MLPSYTSHEGYHRLYFKGHGLTLSSYRFLSSYVYTIHILNISQSLIRGFMSI